MNRGFQGNTADRRRPFQVLVLSGALLYLLLGSARPDAQASAPARAPDHPDPRGSLVAANYAALPLHFEENLGQVDARVGFLTRGPGYTLFLAPDEAVLVLPAPDPAGNVRSTDRSPASGSTLSPAEVSPVIRLRLVGVAQQAAAVGEEQLPGKVNYFIGGDPSDWRTSVPTYARVRYPETYPGIDVVYYGTQGRLEYDFVVAAGADPRAILLNIGGAERLELDGDGNLRLHAGSGEVVLKAPILYQDEGDSKRIVPGGFVLAGERQVRFQVGTYDPSRPLVIDPVLAYSTYLGGSGGDGGDGIAVDSAGNAYIVGNTASADFPTLNPLQPNLVTGGPEGDADIFVAKLNANGTALLYSTYLGGGDGERAHDIAVDPSGNVYVVGDTHSTDFPTRNAFQGAKAGGESAFAAKLNADGSSLIFSTYLGGNIWPVCCAEGGLPLETPALTQGFGIAADGSGNAYVTGYTTAIDFPTTVGAFDRVPGINGGGFMAWDAIVVKFGPTGSIVYSTYLGENSAGGDQFAAGDTGRAIAADSSGNAYVTGETESAGFATTPGAFDRVRNNADAFVTKLNATGSGLVFSTFLGGSSSEEGFGIKLDGSGNIYVAGSTRSGDFPTTAGAFDRFCAGCEDDNSDAFVTKMNPSGSGLVYSTYVGGFADDYPWGLAVDSSGKASIAGVTRSTDFPTANALQAAFRGGREDGFLTKLKADGTALVFSTYLGGSGDDSAEGVAAGSSGVYVTGQTTSADFPTATFDATLGGFADAFVLKVMDAIIVNSTGDGPDADTGDGVCDTGATILRDGAPEPECTLRAAIQEANATQAADTIAFDIPNVAGIPIIQPQAELPAVVQPANLDAATQPGGKVRLDGAGRPVNGLRIAGGGSSVKGLIVTRFDGHGILVDGGAGSIVEGNIIGTDGSQDLGNTGDGVRLSSSNNTVRNNTIAFNDGAGVSVVAGTGNAIRSNPVDSNGGLGIDLGGDGVTVNDPGDADGGPNEQQNFPLLARFARTETSTTIAGVLHSRPNTAFTIEFFATPACDLPMPRYGVFFGEGPTVLGAVSAATDAQGTSRFTATLPTTSSFFTATATDSNGNTSELSQCEPQLELVGMEVVQASQDWRNSVRLVEEKKTVVRAHVQPRQQTAMLFARAELRASRDGAKLPRSPLKPFNEGGNIVAFRDAASRRANLSDSLNFLLPDDWLNGDVPLVIEGVSHGIDCREAGGDAPNTPRDCTISAHFEPVPPLPLTVILVTQIRFPLGGGPVTEKLSTNQITDTLGHLKAILPVREFNLVADSMTDTSQSSDRVLHEIERNKMESGCVSPACDRLYLGIMLPGLVGVSNDIPGSVAVIHPGYPSRYPFMRNGAAHEIAHLLGRNHPYNRALQTSQPSTEPDCGALSPTGQPDFPHYAPMGARGGTIFTISPFDQGQDAMIFGLDTFSMEVVDPTKHPELMGYCNYDFGNGLSDWHWISDFTYEAVLDAIQARYGALTQQSTPAVTTQANGAPQDYVFVSGTLDVERNEAQFLPFLTVPLPAAPPPPRPGGYLLQLRGASGEVLQEIPFGLTGVATRPQQEEELPDYLAHATGTFSIPVPADPAIRQIRLLSAGTALATATASASTPTVQVLFPNGGEQLSGETVTLRWSAGDPDGDPLTYRVQISRDGGTSWETLAADWLEQTLEIPVRELGGTAGGLLRVFAQDGFFSSTDRSDGTFAVPNTSPEPVIASPAPGRVFATDQQILLEGLALDREDGLLAGAMLVWSSNRSGVLGTGEHLPVAASSLPEGPHDITLTATDGAGQGASSSVQIIVVGQTSAADLEITGTAAPVGEQASNLRYDFAVTNRGPNDALSVVLQAAVPAGATVVDATSERGDCARVAGGVRCEIGALATDTGTAVSIVVAPASGGPLIVAAAVAGIQPDPDLGNSTASATAIAPNSPPTAQPAPGRTRLYTHRLWTLRVASFSDAESGDTHTATVNWGDGTSSAGAVDQAAGTVTGSHRYESPGTYSITVTVTDNQGGSGQTSFQIVARPHPRLRQ